MNDAAPARNPGRLVASDRRGGRTRPERVRGLASWETEQ